MHLQETLTLAEYTVRTFSLQMEGSKEERIVKQYHYTVWPDHGVPEYPTSLLQFVRKVMVCNPLNAGPIVVHCRWVGEGGGGGGRTERERERERESRERERERESRERERERESRERERERESRERERERESREREKKGSRERERGLIRVGNRRLLSEGGSVSFLISSAGVGRTGTFITLDAQLKQIKAEKTVDIFGFVRAMRRRRCYMVQTEVWTQFYGAERGREREENALL